LINADISRILGFIGIFFLEDTLHKLAFTIMKMQPKVVNISSDINKPVFPVPLLQIEMYRVRNSQV